MNCPHCDATVGLQKGVRKDGGTPEECPECGESLDKDNPTRLTK